MAGWWRICGYRRRKDTKDVDDTKDDYDGNDTAGVRAGGGVVTVVGVVTVLALSPTRRSNRRLNTAAITLSFKVCHQYRLGDNPRHSSGSITRLT